MTKGILPGVMTVCCSLLLSCESMSYEDYRMEPYDGILTWTEVTEKAQWSNRYDHAAVSYEGKLWVLGGYDSGRLKGDSYLEDVWSSADGADWTLVTDEAPWKGRRGHTVTAFDDGTGEALYLVGGFEVDEETGYRQYSNDVWKSTDGEHWDLIKERSYLPESPDTDFLPRFNHVCVAAKHGEQDYLYVIGGVGMLEGEDARFSFHYFNDVWRSADGIGWEKLPGEDFGMRSEHAACVEPLSGRIYMHGGQYGYTFDNQEGHNMPGADFNEVWYSGDGMSWDVEEVDSLARSGHALLCYADHIWMLPGKSESNHLRFAEGNLFYTYRKELSGEWILDSRGSAFNARHSYAAVVHAGAMWVLGGETADMGPDNDVWMGRE